jgi:sulfate adenylyltransferase
MVSKPHGGRLVQLEMADPRPKPTKDLTENPSIQVSEEVEATARNIALGVLSPLDGFMGEDDYRSVIDSMRLTNDAPWTIPVLLHVPEAARQTLRGDVTLLDSEGEPVAVVAVEETFKISKKEYARKVYGTEDLAHPGVAKLSASSDLVASGRLKSVVRKTTPFDEVTLSPKETRVLFNEKGWRDVIAFQTRNAPHVGHEYVQKMALLGADGLFINPVLGKKKPGDFRDEVIVGAYRALLRHYYPKDSAVMSVLHYEMQYAGPREAIMHAIMRKNFGCTKIAVGRDHAGVGSYYGPYAAQEIFREFPDLGIEMVPMREFYYCRKCEGIANDRICPHPEADRLTFSGTKLRSMFQAGQPPPKEFMRPEVARVILDSKDPFVE